MDKHNYNQYSRIQCRANVKWDQLVCIRVKQLGLENESTNFFIESANKNQAKSFKDFTSSLQAKNAFLLSPQWKPTGIIYVFKNGTCLAIVPGNHQCIFCFLEDPSWENEELLLPRFIDLLKSFNSVSCKAFQKSLLRFCCLTMCVASCDSCLMDRHRLGEAMDLKLNQFVRCCLRAGTELGFGYYGPAE